jgi:hypothetical protein
LHKRPSWIAWRGRPGMPAKKSQGSVRFHGSLGLRELSDRGLVECLTEDRRKGKIYSGTVKGRELTKRL